MVPIHTKPPSREYDEGWDAIFKKTRCKVCELAPQKLSANGMCAECYGRREALRELTELSEEYGGYDAEPPNTPS